MASGGGQTSAATSGPTKQPPGHGAAATRLRQLAKAGTTVLAANRRQAQIGIVSRGASHLAPLYLICRGPRVYTGFPIGASDGGPFCPLPAPCSRPLPSCGAVSPITSDQQKRGQGQSSCICIATRPLGRSRRRKCGNQSSSLQSAGPATRSAGAMDTTGRIFGAAATKHFGSASTSERNQRAAEQRVGVAASPLIWYCGHGGGESGTMGDPSEFHLRRCSRRRAS